MKKIRYILPLIAVIIMTAQNALGAITPTAPTQVDGVYQIGTAEELWGFAQGVNNGTIAVSANAKLTCETSIDLGGSANGSFPGIGSSSKKYSGTFDGNGKTIKGFYQKITATGTGFFKYTNTGAEIKNFILEGIIELNNPGGIYGVGSVAGLPIGTTFEDITSSVNMTLTNVPSSARIFGGMFGRIDNCTVNRCRFCGKIDASASPSFGDRIAGVVGDAKSGTINNTLFDGEIITTVTSGTIYVGGILGRPEGGPVYIKNCLSVGTISVGVVNAYSGMVAGNSTDASAPISNTYYDKSQFKLGDNVTTPTNTFGTDRGTTSWSTITDNLNGGASVTDCNWKVVSGQAWPIPKKWTKTIYTITFVDYDGTELSKQYIEAGSDLTVPSNPSRTGYTFTGWSPAVDTTPTADATYTAQYSINQFTIKFNTDGGDAIADVTKDYNTIITLPSAVKTGYTFTGWNTAQDGSGTSYAGGAKYTITDNATLYAQYTINQYTITYYLDNVLFTTQKYDFGATVTAPEAPAKVGFKFDGWQGVPTTMPANNVDVYGSYSAHVHDYSQNGFCSAAGTCGELYQPITPNDEGVYEITNGGQLFWFANSINSETISLTSKAKLTADISLENKNFPGIGVTNSKCFAGTFDGQGHTISNFYQQKNDYRTGLFSTIKGTSAEKKAIVKNFTLKGSKDVNTTSGMQGSAAGEVEANALLEDVISEVTITHSATSAFVGGLVGCVNNGGTVNRCTYSGSIDCGSTINGIGGIAGTMRGGTISNCLFNGTITNTNAEPSLGGIVGTTTNTDGSRIKNCFSHGTITLANYTGTASGYVLGSAGKTIAISDSYYTTTGSTTLNAVGTGTAEVTQNTVSDATEMAISTLLNNLKANGGEWVLNSNNQPIPGVVRLYTITFKDWDNSVIQTSLVRDDQIVIPPTDPTREGYTFNLWTPTIVSPPTEDATYIAQYSINQYDVKYYVDNILTYTDRYDYGADVTPHAAPEKERYTFSGWSEIPATMPAHDVTVTGTFTYTATNGVYEIGNREDYVNFVAVTKTNAAANAKLIADINLNNEAVDCIGTWASKYSGTFDGQGYTISNYSRTTTDGSYSGMFGAVENATIKNFKVNGSVTISSNVSTSQQHGSVIGVSLGTSLIEDVWSSVNVNITGFAAQVGGFAGRAGGTYNRCRYSGTVTTSTAYDKIGGFASNVYGGTIKNCLFDGTLDLTTNNAELKAGGFVSSNIEQPNHRIESCLVNGTVHIPYATEKCGIVIGFVDRNLNMTKTYYTTTETGSLTTAIGPVTSSWTLTGTAKDATSMDWSDVCEGLNPMTGSDGNWKIETGEGAKAYPVPIACEHTHTHLWDNGICPYDDEYQPISEVNGAYEIGNLGQFLNFVNVVKNTPDANARLTNNFSIANSGFEAIDTYKGTFDGQGHIISGYSRNLTTSITSGTGFFNKTDGATIKNVKFEGSLTISGENKSAFIGTVVGIATNTTFEDVTSSISMSSAATVDGTQSNGLRILGGLVGALRGGSMNRCRYNGVMTFNASTNVIGDRFGGLVGWQQTTASNITNCLFDGTMTVQKNSIYIGGIVGQGLSGSTIQNSLFAGTITQTQGNANCGPIIGNTSSTSVSDTYYDLTGFNYTTAYNNTGTARGSTTWAAIHQALGTANWVTEEGKDYPVPGEQNTEHTHNYENGFCTSLVGVCDARKEVPTYDEATSTYKIANAGQLFSFAEKYNDGTYAEECKAELTAAIDMDGAEHQFPGIGTKDKPFKGTFNGTGKAITEYARSVGDQNGQGFFNYVDGATIKNFSIDGTLDINATAEHYYFGSVAGKITGTTTLEDITSTVIINLNGGKEKAVGGIVGIHDGASVINRCRYQGTINAKNAYNNIGGIAGEENCNAEGGLNNTLFDGIISFNNDNSNEIIVGGLVGVLNSNGANINNCLSHGTITLPTGTHTKAGAVIGYAKDKKINLTRVLFTTCGSVTVAMGTGCSGCTLNVNPSYIPLDVTITAENTKLYNGVALAMLGEDNWRQNGTTNTDYPYPGIGGTAHTHTYNSNGFCIAEDGNYEEATTGTDGYYEIKNAGQLWWIAQQLKEGILAKNIRFKLTQDIDMEGDAHGSFPGICPLGSKLVDGKTEDDWETAFQGIFDGQGHTINNYYRKIQSGLRQGLFNVVNNDAQIKNFNINGNLIVNASNTSSCALVGVVVGVARGTSTIEDINSSVDITASGSRGVGGIVGCLENTNNQPLTKLNRCRYNGTITVSGTNMNDGVGGLAGEIRSAIMTNVLFDGHIIVKSGANYKYIGGIVGVARNNDNSEIHRALSHGTITLEGGYTANEIKNNTTTGGKEVQGSLTGIFIGGIYKTLYLNKCFHTTTGATGVPAIGPQIHEDSETVNGVKKITHTFVDDLLLGSSTDITTTAIIENQYVHIYDHKFHTTLGESNWAIEGYTEGNYPKPKKDSKHIHYYVNGFCTAGDGEYEKPTGGDGNPYIIDNGGKLYWFAEHFNAGEIEQDAIVELKKTSVDESSDKKIDMEGDKYTFPGIGTQKYKFMGKFDGNAFIIENFKRDIVNSEYTGFFNYTENAEIREFQLEGQINYNLNAAKSFHGTVVGYAAGTETLIEDVFSFVEVRMNNNHTRVWGGIAGRASGKINRCRYSGTVAKSVTTTDNGDGTVTTTIEEMTSGEQIGGICGNAQTGLVIENCLFDGTIKSYCYEKLMRVAGILASNELNSNVNITIKNCLFNGCLDLQHKYTGEDGVTQNGIIAGFWSTGTAALINNVYYLKKCADVMKNLDPGNYETTPSVNDTEEIKGDPNWNEIYDNLDEKDEETNPQGNGNWTHTDNGSGDSYPTPGGNHCNHILADGVTSAYDEFGYCTICGDAKPLEKDTDGKYKMKAISDLEGFRDLINSGKNGTVEFNAKLTQDIDFSTWDKDFGEPIGNSHFNRYLYNFDGQGYSLLNVKIKTDDQYVGFFGFAGDTTHDCYIHDLTITGTVESTYDSNEHDNNPLYMGVVGKMYRGKIENVHSQLVLKNTSPTRAVIGGILGAAETEDENNSVVIDKCSFTGICYANAAGNMGGIVGQTSKNTEVKNCTFAGTMIHSYQGVNNQTNFSGVVGYNEESTFKGVQNCVIAGVLKTDDNRVFVNYGTQGNHKNALCGEDKIITNGPTKEYKEKYQGNYAWNVYVSQIPENSVVSPTWVAQEDFISGKVCAIMNAKDDAPTDVQNGHPWGQVLGYQIGDITKDKLIGNHTEGSPAQRVPFPGYQNPEKNPWKVIKDASNNYTADWYYFDDQGDSTPFPTDAASMKVKKIEYHRAPEYLTYYNSFCLPFEFTQTMKTEIDTNAKIFLLEDNPIDGTKVIFEEKTEGSIPAGTPFILYCDRNDAWNYINTTEGASLAMKVTNATGVGLYGSFQTIETGAGYYKLNQDGTKLVKTIGASDTEHGPLSHCYPYRAYFKLTTTSGAKAHDEEYIPCFVSADEIMEFNTDDNKCYNIMGQQVNENAKGIIIVNGKKYLKR